jgi:hypothetical protein
VRNLATSISVVLGGVIFQNRLSSNIGAIASQLPPQLAATLETSSFGSATADLKLLDAQQKRLLDQAFTDALQKIWIFYTAFAFVGIIVAVVGIKKKELKTEKENVKTGLAEQERVRLEEKQEEADRKERKKSAKAGRGSLDGDVEKASPPTSPVRGGEGVVGSGER